MSKRSRRSKSGLEIEWETGSDCTAASSDLERKTNDTEDQNNQKEWENLTKSALRLAWILVRLNRR